MLAKQKARLAIGSMVDQWKVESLLGEGAFGAVYVVTDPDGLRYALKAESKDAQYQILKMEVCVLMELEKIQSSHFVKIFDRGRKDDYKFIVMTLVGKSILDLNRERPTRRFSMGTALGIAIKTLEALKDLHTVGYLHRDVKSGNFAVGRPEKKELRHLYVLDFGICRKYLSKDGSVRRQRKVASFRGTARYASRACHAERELGRKDDVESWTYMCIEFIVGKLPWKEIRNIYKVGDCKNYCREDPGLSEMCEGCPPEMKQIVRLNNAITYYDAPPYKEIFDLLRGAFKTMNVKEYPYDWEEGAGSCPEQETPPSPDKNPQAFKKDAPIEKTPRVFKRPDKVSKGSNKASKKDTPLDKVPKQPAPVDRAAFFRQLMLKNSPKKKNPSPVAEAIPSPAVKSPAVKSPAVKSPAVKSPAVKSPAVKTANDGPVRIRPTTKVHKANIIHRPPSPTPPAH